MVVVAAGEEDQAFLRGLKTDWVVEKAVEEGNWVAVWTPKPDQKPSSLRRSREGEEAWQKRGMGKVRAEEEAEEEVVEQEVVEDLKQGKADWQESKCLGQEKWEEKKVRILGGVEEVEEVGKNRETGWATHCVWLKGEAHGRRTWRQEW